MDIKNNKKDYLGHRQRIKQKFQAHGFGSFNDYEILELALTFSLPRKDTKPLAKELIKRFGSLKDVFDADKNLLKEVSGISENSAVFIKFLKSFASLYMYLNAKQRKITDSPEKTVEFLKTALTGEKVEKTYVVLIDSANKVIECLEVESGTVNKSVIIPRKIAELALKYKAVSVIIAHNHPGGTLQPSKGDLEATENVKNALLALEISLLDHIIIAGNKYYSFKENFLI